MTFWSIFFSPFFFACGLRLHRKTYPPILVHWFLCRVPQITCAKMQFFYLAASFPNKAFVFPNNGISNVCISRQGWFRKTCTFACVISLKRKTNSRKNYGAMFSHEVQGHMQKFNSFGGKKKKGLKSHLCCLCTCTFN